MKPSPKYKIGDRVLDLKFKWLLGCEIVAIVEDAKQYFCILGMKEERSGSWPKDQNKSFEKHYGKYVDLVLEEVSLEYLKLRDYKYFYAVDEDLISEISPFNEIDNLILNINEELNEA